MEIYFELEKRLGEFLLSEGCSSTVKFLDKRLSEMGDLIIKSKTDSSVHLDAELLKQTSASWPLQVERVEMKGNLVHVWFERSSAFRRALTTAEWELPMKRRTDYAEQIYVEEPTVEAGRVISMTTFRANALRKVTKNCLIHAGYDLVDKDQLEENQRSTPVKKIMFVEKKNKITYDQLNELEQQLLVEVLAGPVLTGSDLADANKYLVSRSNEMQLMAQHRYGVRIHDINKLMRIVASLGRSAAIVDVLQPKHSSTIDMRGEAIEPTRSPTSSKGAVFILYNFVRLASIFQKYRVLMQKNGYPTMPAVEESDFKLLTDPDEWHLLYVYVIGFPAALERTLGNGQLKRIVPHHILEFTFGLVGYLSKYYRRTKILTDNRPKLVPVMIARLHLLEAVFKILQVLLNLLDLEPLEEM